MHIGSKLERQEDARLISGTGIFVNDIEAPGTAYAASVPSANMHARLRPVSVKRALQTPVVLALLTNADWRAAGLGQQPPLWLVTGRLEHAMNEMPRRALVSDKVRHVGDPVAPVIADGMYPALSENCIYKTTTDQLLSGSLSDYALPRADDLPGFLQDNQAPCVLAILSASKARARAA